MAKQITYTHKVIITHTQVLPWLQRGQVNTNTSTTLIKCNICILHSLEFACIWLDTHTRPPPCTRLVVFHSHHPRLTKGTVTFKWNYRCICIFLLSLKPLVGLRRSSRGLTALHVAGGVLINSVKEKWPPVGPNCEEVGVVTCKNTQIDVLSCRGGVWILSDNYLHVCITL